MATTRTRWIFPAFPEHRIVFCGDWGSASTSRKMLFEKQHILTETVTGERHARDSVTGAYLYDQWGDPIMEEYEYKDGLEVSVLLSIFWLVEYSLFESEHGDDSCQRHSRKLRFRR